MRIPTFPYFALNISQLGFWSDLSRQHAIWIFERITCCNDSIDFWIWSQSIF